VSAQPSLLLDVVRTQEANNGRRLYYQHMHEVYGAPMPDNGSMARRLHIEKHVLSILDAVRDTRIQARPAVSSLRRIAAPVREATLANWLEPLQAAFWWGSFDENTSVSVQDVRVLLAVDQLLLSHSSLDLLEQLSWWLVQRLTALGWPQGYIAVAGGKEVANHTVKEDCYSLAATRFGLLLASESAVKLFTRDSRRQAQAFLRDLLTVFRELAASASWLSEKARAVVNKTLQELQAENIDDNLVPWIEISGAAYKAGSLKCGADFIPNLREIAALGIAWHALKKRTAAAVKGSDSDGRRQLPATALSIPDSNGEVHVYTGDQLFFLNHCRSRCDGR
ncbi:hypothetical protein V5799_017775, partial [Amblyomma americanum]